VLYLVVIKDFSSVDINSTVHLVFNAADSADDLIDLDQASSLLKPIFYAEDRIIIYDANSASCKRHVI